MNLIKRLFGRRLERMTSGSIKWRGQSGKEYSYEIRPIESSFRPLPGNFIYAKQDEDGAWIPIYIAQSRDLHQRLEGHVRVADAVHNGATHIHAHYCSTGPSARFTEERDLILRWQPVCNDPVET